jgi:hypothetical protein
LRALATSVGVASAVLASACNSSALLPPDASVDAAMPSPDAPADAPAPPPIITITTTVNSTRFVTREHMLAAGEMQISGEPLAEAMGRDLGGYSRDMLPTDIYNDPVLGALWIDVPGFSTGVESYEYSKQPMNNLAFESGAGTSLAYAPLVDFDGAVGSAATAHLADLVQHFAGASDAEGEFVFPVGTFPVGNPFGDRNPHGLGSAAENILGWPGIWPTAHVFASFDPTIAPTSNVNLVCSLSSDDSPSESGQELDCADYECDATTLHLVDRAAQIDPTITPGADGFSGWKYGLWTLNYLQIMHDATDAAVATVDSADLASVGSPGNTIIGQDASGAPTSPGTFVGSSKVEGFQASMFIAMADNRAEDWLTHLSTSDGATLDGFASLFDALGYGYASPLRWFPGKIAVTEADGGDFPQPSYALASADSDALDLVGLALAYAEFFALTDTNNRDVGGAQTAEVFFDGDPFPADDQLADGEPTLHDRALAMMRVAIVDLDRLHTDPASGLLVDDVAMAGATPTRGHTISTTTIAYAMIALRTVARSLSSQLELYSNNTPDMAVVATPLDTLPIDYPNDPSLTFSARIEQMIRAHAALLYDHLTDDSGRAYDGWDVVAGAPVDTADTLDAHTAAIRGLFAAFLATGDTRYRDRAMVVFQRMQAVFYDPVARIYSATPAPVDDVEFTPLRFALLQSSLRDVYEVVASRAGGEDLELPMEALLARLNKLVLDGWDDRNGDNHIDWPEECTAVDGAVPLGGLEMGERTLTGEIGSLDDRISNERIPTIDRNSNCVPEIDDAHLPAALADSVTFHIARP